MNPESIIHAFDEGERELEPLLEKMGWTSWLGVAELGLLMGSDIVDFLADRLSEAETATLELVNARIDGTISLDKIESALEIARNPETRDLALEGRLRMERGLVLFEQGDTEGARDDLAWAETRLKSVAKASRDHDISLLNKAAFHLAVDESLMALQVHGEISRHAGHAHETVAISRLQAARIYLGFGHMYDAARNAFNAHVHSMIAKQVELAVESGAIFVEVSSNFIDEEAERMADQVLAASPRSIEDEAHTLAVHPEDVYGVLEWCIQNTTEGYSGEERPDLRALLMLAKRLDRVDLFADLLNNPTQIEDAMLAALCSSCVDDDSAEIWTARLSEMMTLPEYSE